MNRKLFFESIRTSLFQGSMTVEQVQGIEAKLDAMQNALWPLTWAAYGLATSYWETGQKMQPVREIGKGRGRKYGAPAGPHGHVYYGRGDVQLTWLANYKRAGEALALDLVRHPDLALDPANSARIMIEGMEQGWFTYHKMRDHLQRGKVDYINARRIINGTDKAVRIADIAQMFERALTLSGYGVERPSTSLIKPAHVAPAPLPPPPDIPKPDEPVSTPPRGFWARFMAALREIGRAHV